MIRENRRQQRKQNNKQIRKDAKYNNDRYDRDKEVEEAMTRTKRRDQEKQENMQCMFQNLHTIIPVVMGTTEIGVSEITPDNQ